MPSFFLTSDDLPGPVRLENMPNMAVASEVICRLIDGRMVLAADRHNDDTARVVNWSRVRWVEISPDEPDGAVWAHLSDIDIARLRAATDDELPAAQQQ